MTLTLPTAELGGVRLQIIDSIVQARVRYILFICLLLASFCLLTILAALVTVGPIPGTSYYYFNLGGHNWSIDPSTSETTVAYDFKMVALPVSRWSLILLSLLIPALACVCSTGVLAWSIFQHGGGKT